MAVTCKNCGGSHPLWECHATAKQIAAYAASKTTLPHAAAPVRVAKGGAGDVQSQSLRGEAGANPAKLQVSGRAKSTAARKDVQRSERPVGASIPVVAGPGSIPGAPALAGTQAPPVDTLKQAEAAAAHLAPKKRGRPRTIIDMRAYKAEKERDRRKRRAEGK